MFRDKFQITPDQNRRFARANFVKLVHTDARFEGVNTTLPQTQTIMDGLGVNGVPIDDINVIVQLKRGWQYITTDDHPLTLEVERHINKIVALHDSLDPGHFRTGNSTVQISSKEDFVPPDVDVAAEEKWLADLLNDAAMSDTERALRLLYHNMRGQLFWDGNKRTAMLTVNKLMIDHGVGLINVPLDKWPDWNNLISQYYRSGDMAEILAWTYTNGIQGVNLSITTD